MKNKKGFLLAEETLKIVIAVICIGFLVYFLISLYFTSRTSKELEFAEASLNNLLDEVKSGVTEVEIYNPKDWIIVVWPHEVDIGMPKTCLNIGWENCICICKEPVPFLENLLDNCDKNGVCLGNNLELNIEEDSIKINKVPFKIKIENNMISEK